MAEKEEGDVACHRILMKLAAEVMRYQINNMMFIKENDKQEHVDHPDHYNREGAMECIDEMVEVFGVAAVRYFCLLNVWKYRFRAAEKNGAEDLKKSDWYMKKYIELKGNDDDGLHG